MKAHIIVNGSVTLAISPENKLEEEALKQLMKQNNETIEIRTSQHILNKNVSVGSLIIQKIHEDGIKAENQVSDSKVEEEEEEGEE